MYLRLPSSYSLGARYRAIKLRRLFLRNVSSRENDREWNSKWRIAIVFIWFYIYFTFCLSFFLYKFYGKTYKNSFRVHVHVVLIFMHTWHFLYLFRTVFRVLFFYRVVLKQEKNKKGEWRFYRSFSFCAEIFAANFYNTMSVFSESIYVRLFFHDETLSPNSLLKPTAIYNKYRKLKNLYFFPYAIFYIDISIWNCIFWKSKRLYKNILNKYFWKKEY